MSIADAQRVIALEKRMADLAERNLVLVARVAALEDHVADFQAAVEARQRLESSTVAPTPSHLIPARQGPPSAPEGDAEACPSCARRRDQAQARLRRHRAKNAAAEGKALQKATA
jgi:hypothetical protein